MVTVECRFLSNSSVFNLPVAVILGRKLSTSPAFGAADLGNPLIVGIRPFINRSVQVINTEKHMDAEPTESTTITTATTTTTTTTTVGDYAPPAVYDMLRWTQKTSYIHHKFIYKT